ncbi:MAG TPA: preprotein translocase subunit YajC [Oscillospiraceae bacterium]|nr:preprotein translocase subunit YajC [Oscillospiraceae bacterium]HPS35579.1 preprotein translocase subunit YajC [Oscillospiraceae bacterium]
MNVFFSMIGRLLEAATPSTDVLTAATTGASVTSVVNSVVNTVVDSTASTASTASGAASLFGGSSIWSTVLLFGVLILAMYFLMIRPQKKRDKEQKMMRDALSVGDEIVTIGGISGTVVSVREDSVIIETGSDRDKLKIMKWAIQTITAMRKSADDSSKE